jgi:hypothetical protein
MLSASRFAADFCHSVSRIKPKKSNGANGRSNGRNRMNEGRNIIYPGYFRCVGLLFLFRFQTVEPLKVWLICGGDNTVIPIGGGGRPVRHPIILGLFPTLERIPKKEWRQG